MDSKSITLIQIISLTSLTMNNLRKVLLISICILANIGINAQYYTRYNADKELEAKAKKWITEGKWRCGFTAASPHDMVNIVEFYKQYHKNAAQWNSLFEWLANNDLLAVPAGKIAIPKTKLVVSVEDSQNRPLEKCATESHYHHVDFMYVVKGVERFGLLDHYTSKQNAKYRPDVMRYKYDVTRTKFIDSSTDKFIIMFPDDWHISKVATDLEDQSIRVLVIKVDYID